jgi:hypothetical protein
MSATLTVDAIIFSIHSAIKLGRGLEKAYANSIKGKAIVLPLPAINPEVNFTRMTRFFDEEEGSVFVKPKIKIAGKTVLNPQFMPLFKELNDKAQQGEDNLSEGEKVEYQQCFLTLYKMEKGISDISYKDVEVIFQIRQWEKGMIPNPSPLQMVAGTLVEIGVDYFNQIPGAIRSDSTAGKFVKSFLTAIDGVEFAENDNLKHTLVKELIPKLFVSTAETLGEEADRITDNEKLQRFIGESTKGIAKDIYTRIDKLGTADDQEEVIRWGQLVFRSMIKNAGTYVVNSSGDLFGVGDQEAALIKSVGEEIMSALLDQDSGGVKLKNLFTPETLDEVVKAALEVVAQYPELVSKRNGVKEIVSGVASAVAQSGIKQPGIVPEIARLILLNTAGNLEALWDINDPNAKHLLVSASHQILTALTAKPGEKWKPKLTKHQIIILLEDLLEDVVANPDWINAKVNDDSLLSDILDSTFNALKGVSEGNRLNFNTLELVLEINIRTVATSKLALKKIKWGNRQEEVTIINHALNLVFSFVFTQKRSADRTVLLIDLLDYIMEVLVAQHPNSKGLLLTKLILQEDFEVIKSNGFDRETADLIVEATLGVLSAHPDLISKNEALQNMITGVALALSKSGINQPGIISEFIRLTLVHAAGNMNLIIKSDDHDPEHLFVIALQQIVTIISKKPSSGKWKPKITGTQLLMISENLLEEVVHNPAWITDKINDNSLMSEVLNSTFGALENVPEGQRFSLSTLELLIQLNLRAVATSRQVLSKIKWGSGQEETTILNKALDLIYSFVFKDQNAGDKTELLIDLTDYIMNTAVTAHPNKKGLALVQLLLNAESGVIRENGLNKEAADKLVSAALNVISAHPELLVNNEALQNIIGGVGSALADSGIKEPHLFTEFIRLVLLNAAGNLDLMVNTTGNVSKHLLVEALTQVLDILTAKPTQGKWKPKLTGAQTLAISENLLDDVVKNPNWVIKSDDEDSLLSQVLKTTFSTLELVPKGQRLSGDTVERLIRVNMRTVAVSEAVLSKIKWGSGRQETTILNKALDLVFEFVFEDNPTVDKSELLYDLLDYILNVIIVNHPNKTGLTLVMMILQKDLQIISANGINDETANELIEAALYSISEHPELISSKTSIQSIVSGIAKELTQNGIKQPHILSEFVRLILSHTAGNLNLLIDTSRRRQKHIMVVALQQILKAMSSRPNAGKWKPKLTDAQILDITEVILEEVVANPQWVQNDHIRTLISAVYRGLESVPNGMPLHYSTIKILIQDSLKAVNFRKQLMVDLITNGGGTQKLAITYSIDELFLAIYDGDGNSTATWTLTQTDVINAIIERYLLAISGKPIKKSDIDESVAKIKKAVSDLNSNLKFNLQEFLETLEDS